MAELRVLLVEDEEDDAILVLRELRRAGYDVYCERVCTAETMRAALIAKVWDVVLSDYSMPELDAPGALRELKASGLDLPFIIMSGTIGEEKAVECMRAGAHDFMIKSRLARLGAAIEREMGAAHGRAARRLEEKKNRELEIARLEAERTARFKAQFLANMSHELRTPLNAIIGFSEILQRSEAPNQLNETQQEFLGYVLECGQHLLRLIDDVLDISAIEAGRIELALKSFAPGELAHQVMSVVRPLAIKREIQLHIDVGDQLEMAHGDSRRLKQVLFNLLSNAIKFSAVGGHVRLGVASHAGTTTFVVSDQGIGIRTEDQARLFREFERIDPSSGHQGTGLGLALTKHLVELHGGTLSVVSEFGVGSTFTVALPNRPPAQAADVS